MEIKQRRIAVVGATGLVGQMIIKILQEENVRAEFVYFNSKNLTKAAVMRFKPHFALFAVSAQLAREWVPYFVSKNCIVIDNSSAYRRDDDVPLIIPECNGGGITLDAKIISNPNCSTIGALVALKPLDDAYRIRRIVYTTFQAISGAGANPIFAHLIENNIIPYIHGEEDKMEYETQKILGRDVAVTATCVRIPIANCHSIAINVEFENPVDLVQANAILASAPGLILVDSYPMPIMANGRNEVFVGRVRIDRSRPNALNLFTVSDNVRKGAAVNAVQILKCLMSL